ncbi:Protein of unknown function [Pyronema omphalodes CBS 100304]|uniref:Uncharacterized protein n=1 Tax=Pyronema omphalodes (strain CBS 100304) TaxID=1076935 RepID=U4LCH7_PYROM|nr:Protein of unknown function [Pyronema omphalodes CBS 100304]
MGLCESRAEMSWGERLEGLDDRVFCGRCSQAILEQCQLSLLSGQE